MARVTARPQAQAQTQTRPAAQPQPTPAVKEIPHEKIAQRAYEKWVKRGCDHGRHAQDWTEAEAELRAESESVARHGVAPAPRR